MIILHTSTFWLIAFLVWLSGLAGGIATLLLMGCSKCAARRVPRDTIDDVAARDERAFARRVRSPTHSTNRVKL